MVVTPVVITPTGNREVEWEVSLLHTHRQGSFGCLRRRLPPAPTDRPFMIHRLRLRPTLLPRALSASAAAIALVAMAHVGDQGRADATSVDAPPPALFVQADS
jgi:hypothetical protein